MARLRSATTLGFAQHAVMLKKMHIRMRLAKAKTQVRAAIKQQRREERDREEREAEQKRFSQKEWILINAMRKGGKDGSNAFSKMKSTAKNYDEDFYSFLVGDLIKGDKYQMARSVFLLRLKLQGLYNWKVCGKMIQVASKNNDRKLVQQITEQIEYFEYENPGNMPFRDRLKVIRAAAECGVDTTASTMVEALLGRLRAYQEEESDPIDEWTGEDYMPEAEPDDAGASNNPAGTLSPNQLGGQLAIAPEGGEIEADITTESVQFDPEIFMPRRQKNALAIFDDDDYTEEEFDKDDPELEELNKEGGKDQYKLQEAREKRKMEIIALCEDAKELAMLRQKRKGDKTMKVEKNDLMILYNKLIAAFGKYNNMSGIMRTLEVMRFTDMLPDDVTYEYIANAAVRSVEFVTSAVSMETLPEALNEVAFVGRSNVGKSSLVNMLTNRKTLAKVSNTPGKTKQFNYFVVNRNNPYTKAFYFVDMPGVGYARVPGELRNHWTEFTKEFFTERKSLKVIFHLVDAKVGVQKHDLELMELVYSLGMRYKYCVVLTKVDKLGNKRVATSVIDGVLDALEMYNMARVRVIPTSAEYKLGREQLWMQLFRKKVMSPPRVSRSV